MLFRSNHGIPRLGFIGNAVWETSETDVVRHQLSKIGDPRDQPRALMRSAYDDRGGAQLKDRSRLIATNLASVPFSGAPRGERRPFAAASSSKATPRLPHIGRRWPTALTWECSRCDAPHRTRCDSHWTQARPAYRLGHRVAGRPTVGSHERGAFGKTRSRLFGA